MQIVTRAEAREQGRHRYFTGKPCRYGHHEERFTRDARCVACARDHSAKSRKRHIEARRATNREYARQRSEALRPYRADYYRENRDSMLAANREWRERNPDVRREHRRRYYAAKVRATPAWVDKEEIDAFYRACPDGYEVDHIVPLQGKAVSGLHVPWNLQYLTPVENAQKGNRLIEE